MGYLYYHHSLSIGVSSRTGDISTTFAYDLPVYPTSRNTKEVNHKIAASAPTPSSLLKHSSSSNSKSSEGKSWAWRVKLDVLDDIEVPRREAHLRGSVQRSFRCARFQPIAYVVKEVIKSGILGRLRRFSADLSMDPNFDALPDSSRMINPALGGGSLFGMSIYPSVWAMLLVHHHPLNTDKESKTARVEPRHSTPTPVAIAPSVPKAPSPPPPLTATLSMMSYEADEVTRCIRDGKIESERISWEENRVM
ncbi:hypothetical protein D1P53_005495 [Cryptococcus gattii VGV]|nr:hypothetical protein D1P53_005495 [Cryptococcus gattii VGV]